MAKRKTPARYTTGPKKGQFKPKGASSSRASSAKRKAPAKRRTVRRNPGRTVARKRAAPRRNPPKMKLNPSNIMGQLIDSSIEAGQILVGKAAARSIPDLVGLPKQGNVGLAIQTAVALASGFAASMFMSPQAARAITAGGLTAPLETLVVAYRIPWLSEALAPVTANAELGAYVRGRAALPAGNGNGVGAYVRRAVPERGLGRYAVERGMQSARG